MIALTLRGLGARKLRTALTGIAIVLGVAMISGSFILTDTMNRSFDSLFQTGYAGVDVAVTAKTPGDLDVDQTGGLAPIPESLVARVAAVSGVDEAAGTLTAEAGIQDKQGKAIGQNSPSFVTGIGAARFNPFRFVEGREPKGTNEVALDAKTARDHGFKLGDQVRVVGEDGAKSYRMVGIARFGNVDSLAGASLALLPLAEAQRLVGKVGQVDEIDAAAEEGVSPEELQTQIAAQLRDQPVEVRTGQQTADRQSADFRDGLGFLRTALLIFGGIAVFVGSFVIYNTFSITVAQRTRELALLRTLGASRGQVLRSVALEALIIGVVASLLGLAAGLLVAPGLAGLFSTFGLDLPTDDMVVQTRTIIVALLVGTLITLIASVAPALRAMRVAPIAAMREGLAPVRRRRRPLGAVTFLIAGGALVLIGLFGGSSGGQAASLLGIGAAVTFFGVALLTPRLVGPLASAIGAPLERIFGLSGRLARENASRSPSRTAVTASALMIGVALVAFVSIFAAGLRGSIDGVVDRSFAGDLIVSNQNGFGAVSSGLQSALDREPGVESTTGFRFSESRVRGVADKVTVVATDPSAAQTYKAKWKQGNDALLGRLGPGDAIVDAESTVGKNRKVGDRLRVTTPTGRRLTLTVRGLISEGQFGLLGEGIVVSTDLAREAFAAKDPFFLVVRFTDGAPADTPARIDRLLEQRFANAQAQDREEFKKEQSAQVNQLLALVYVLLALSVLVSLFGILNTLALSVFERTRELGMLRAIGASRRQIKRVVRLEAVITSLMGASLGVVLGVLFALLVSRPLENDGFVLTIPVGSLFTLLVIAALFGVVAAISPARRAAKTKILDAVAYE